MLHHVSIGAENPANVAKVLAEILQGQAHNFPVFPDSYMVTTWDKYGTAIEIYPLTHELIPEELEVGFQKNTHVSRYGSTHLALSVPISQDEIEKIANREGWRCLYCNRGGAFDVIEFWIENRLLLELMPQELQSRYLDFMTPSRWEKFLGVS